MWTGTVTPMKRKVRQMSEEKKALLEFQELLALWRKMKLANDALDACRNEQLAYQLYLDYSRAKKKFNEMVEELAGMMDREQKDV